MRIAANQALPATPICLFYFRLLIGPACLSRPVSLYRLL